MLPDDRPSESPLPIAPGVFLTKGMIVRIPAGGLSIGFGPNGLTGSLTLHVGVDVCPTWLQISEHHLVAAKSANGLLQRAAGSSQEEDIGRLLAVDLVASMQSVVAAATAIDGFYAALREHVGLDDKTLAAWRDGRTARYRQVAEVVRRAFTVKPSNAKQIRRALQQLYRFRDSAVHPGRTFGEAVAHPEAGRNTARLYATFRYPNARELAGVGLSVISQGCLRAEHASSPGVRRYCEELWPHVEPILAVWESNHGQLFARVPSPPS